MGFRVYKVQRLRVWGLGFIGLIGFRVYKVYRA